MSRTSPALVPFLAVYPLLLTLEGALYGAQERSTVSGWRLQCILFLFI